MKDGRMTEQEQAEYIAKLRSPEFKLESTDPLEVAAFEKARAAHSAIMAAQAQVKAMDQEMKRLDEAIGGKMRQMDTTNGEVAAYTRLLVLAEESRRAAAEKLGGKPQLGLVGNDDSESARPADAPAPGVAVEEV